MKKHIIIYFSILSFFVPSILWATADGPDCWDVHGVASNDVLNIREKPSAKSKIIGSIPPRAKKIKNITEYPEGDMASNPNPGWCKVEYKKAQGWVSCKFLQEGDACE